MDEQLDDGLAGAAAGGNLPEQQEAALAEATSWVGGEVSAVGLGRTDDGDPCVVVHTSGEVSDLPAEVAGLPVRVEHSGPILALEEVDDSD